MGNSKYNYIPNWRTIRILGELKILTKTSYISLFFVPFLVVIWDGIEVAKVKWNTVGPEKITQLASLAEFHVDKSIKQVIEIEEKRNLKLTSIIDRLLKIQEEVKEVKANSNISGKIRFPLPNFWIQVFLCAIFVGLGHVIYQIGCPEEIQKHSLDSYTNNEKSLFTKHGTITDLKKAEENLRKTSDEEILIKRKEYRLIVDKIKTLTQQKKKEEFNKMKLTDLYGIKDILSRNQNKSESEIKMLDFITNRLKNTKLEEIELDNLNTIGNAAEIKYREMANKTPILIVLSGLFYIVGIYLLILIIQSQIFNVLNAGRSSSNWFNYFGF